MKTKLLMNSTLVAVILIAGLGVPGQKNSGPTVCPVPQAPTSDTTCYAGSGCLDVAF